MAEDPVRDRQNKTDGKKMRVKLIASGSYTPEYVVTNDDLSKILDTSDEWIASRTGIRERRIEKSGSTSKVAIQAARAALENLSQSDAPGAEMLGAEDLDLILVASSTPDKNFPSCACEVQGAIGAVHATAFDLSAACTGFVFALNTAAAYLKSGMARRAMVIGADVMSKTLDWTDRSSCVLFGDGAGAVILQAEPDECEAERGSDLMSVYTGADGRRSSVLNCDLRYHNTDPETIRNCTQMDGQEVFKFAVKTVAGIIHNLAEQEAGQTGGTAEEKLDEVKYFLLHQANIRIIEAVAKRLGQPMEKFPVNLAHYGNTSAASIAILLDELNRAGELNRGDKLVLSGFGAGLTYGASQIIF